MADPERRELELSASAAVHDDRLPSNEFLAALSHEIRNPLSPILGAAQILRSLCKDPRQQLAIETIERQVVQLTHLMDSVVDAAQLRRGELNLAMQSVDVTVLAKQALEAVKPKIDARRQSLYVTLPSGPVQMHCDPKRLVQVIQSLLDNAHRQTPERGSIALTVADEDTHLSIEVNDNGYGIEPELLPRIFNLFAPGDARLHRAASGLGVGLAIARNLVELHGGSIVARSAGAGQGSCFSVRLPIEKAEPPPPAKTAASVTIVPQRKILIVEDNDSEAKGLAGSLTEFGYTVVTAADGTSAIQLANEFLPDVAIVDIGLPDLEGYDVARELRSIPAISGALLIAASGNHLRAFRQVSDHLVFDHYLLKPVGAATLSALIEHDMGTQARPAT